MAKLLQETSDGILLETGTDFLLTEANEYSLVSALGTFTLTGIASGLYFGKIMSAAYGSFTLTGQDIVMRIAMRITAAYGAFVFTGQTALLKIGRLMRAVTGYFTLTGQTLAMLINGIRSYWADKFSRRGDSWSNKY